MKLHRTLALAAAIATLGLISALPAHAAETPVATASREGWYHQLVDAGFVAGYAVLPERLC